MVLLVIYACGFKHMHNLYMTNHITMWDKQIISNLSLFKSKADALMKLEKVCRL